jgi:hypothetical protein
VTDTFEMAQHSATANKGQQPLLLLLLSLGYNTQNFTITQTLCQLCTHLFGPPPATAVC